MPPRANNSSAAVLAALVLGLFWCVEGIDVNAPQLDRVVLLLAGLGLAWAALRDAPFVAGSTAYYAVLVAASERLHRQPLQGGSDVMRATAESLDVVFAGGNPYTHVLQSTIPVGSPFVYPPGELAWYAVPYALFGDITRVDTWAGIAIVAIHQHMTDEQPRIMFLHYWGVGRTSDLAKGLRSALDVSRQ